MASTEQLDESSCWYVNDELGSCIPHSDTPNVKLIPFLYAPNNKLDDKVISYTLLWPTKEINEGDTLTRDYLNGLKEEKQRSTRMAAWYRLPESKYISMNNEHVVDMFKLCADSVTLLEKFYNQNALDQMERASKVQYDDKKLTVYSDYPYINEYLNHE